MPWNQTTLLGYFGESFIVAVDCTSYLFTTGVFLLLFLSLCIHHQAFHKMFKHSIDTLNQCDKNCCDEKYLCGLIRF